MYKGSIKSFVKFNDNWLNTYTDWLKLLVKPVRAGDREFYT